MYINENENKDVPSNMANHIAISVKITANRYFFKLAKLYNNCSEMGERIYLYILYLRCLRFMCQLVSTWSEYQEKFNWIILSMTLTPLAVSSQSEPADNIQTTIICVSSLSVGACLKHDTDLLYSEGRLLIWECEKYCVDTLSLLTMTCGSTNHLNRVKHYEI